MGRSFVRFCCKGEPDDARQPRRWFCDLHVKPDIEDSLMRGTPVGNWDSTTRFTPKVRGPIEDMPWCMGSVPVISDRMRRIIEDVAPGDAQFLSVRILYGGEPFDAGQPFWVANWLHVYDLAAGTEPAVLQTFTRSHDSRARVHDIPPDVHVFRWRSNPFVEFMSTELRDRLLGEGITGIQFS